MRDEDSKDPGAKSRLVSVLEGGYNTMGLSLAVESHIKTLLGGDAA